MAITLLRNGQTCQLRVQQSDRRKYYIMANPFGLPKVILAEREARRRRQLWACVYTLLITATILIMGMLIQGCQTQQSSLAELAAPRQTMHDCRSPREKSNPLPTPMATSESVDETNWTTPQSASLPENVPMPEPAPAPTSPDLTPTPSLPVTPVHATSSRHAKGIYVVKSGDTLSRIAKTHGISVKALKTANHLKSDRIVVGEKLILSQAKPAASHTVQN